MQSKSDFWLTLHKLVHDFEREGDTDEARIENLKNLLQAQRSAAMQVYCDDLETAVRIVAKLLAACRDAQPEPNP